MGFTPFPWPRFFPDCAWIVKVAAPGGQTTVPIAILMSLKSRARTFPNAAFGLSTIISHLMRRTRHPQMVVVYGSLPWVESSPNLTNYNQVRLASGGRRRDAAGPAGGTPARRVLERKAQRDEVGERPLVRRVPAVVEVQDPPVHR